ncbi:two-component system response regulator [Pedobacter sp. L105]|uniref:response regulator n=1 Tax=Pedobacter sp. L105 TaxID=1641871 RepID=UPI00131E8A81|nr:response regulator [Pedobacter sp. L105]
MRKKILVIDDDEDILSILDIILEGEGYETILYSSGTTPEEVNRLNPDLILLDIRIAGFPKTGVEICTEFKSRLDTALIPVLLISAEENIEFLVSDCGANGFINKPFNIHMLVDKVKEFLT